MGDFALFDLGPRRIAVATQHVVQATPYPQNLTSRPRASHALEGVFMHRGQLVPLVNLLKWIDPQSPHNSSSQQVLVLQADGKVIGILVDAIKGLLRTPDENVRAVHHDNDALEFFHSVVLAQDGVTLLSLLDPARLAMQAQVWAREIADSGAEVTASTVRNATPLETVVVVRLNKIQMALPAVAVGEVLTGAVVKTMRGLGREFIGMTRWRGADIPVIDMAALLGLPEPQEPNAQWLVVLSFDNRMLAFYVHEMCAVRAMDASGLQLESGMPQTMKALCLGTYLSQSGERVVALDVTALLRAVSLSQLAPGDPAKDAKTVLQLGFEGGAGIGALVVFKSKQQWAASMQGMREITKVPAAFHKLGATGALLGSMEWRGQALALVDLRKTFDAQPSVLSDAARVIVAEHGAHITAWLVEGVSGLIPAHTGTRSRFTAKGALVEMVTVGSGAEQQSYQLMEFSQLQYGA